MKGGVARTTGLQESNRGQFGTNPSTTGSAAPCGPFLFIRVRSPMSQTVTTSVRAGVEGQTRDKRQGKLDENNGRSKHKSCVRSLLVCRRPVFSFSMAGTVMIRSRVPALITALAMLFATLVQAVHQTQHPQDQLLALSSEFSSHKCVIHVIGLASGSAYRLTISLRFGGSMVWREVELDKTVAGSSTSTRCPFNSQCSFTCDISMT